MSNGLMDLVRPAWRRYDRNKDKELGPYFTFTNYKRIERKAILLLCATALIPLLMVSFIHYQLIHRSIDSEFMLRTERLTSNARRAVSFFLESHLNALRFVADEKGYEELRDSDRLVEILKHVKLGFGGVTDLSVISHTGTQVAYAGPFDQLAGRDYSQQPWFIKSAQKERNVSGIFKGYRSVPHFIITVKSSQPDGNFFILRATLETEELMRTLSAYETGEYSDLFLIDRAGIIQTPSKFYGNIFQRLTIPVPTYASRTKAVMRVDHQKRKIILGYAFISTQHTDTPFVLMVVKQKAGMMGVWHWMRTRINWLIGFLVVAIILIITVACTYMVNKLFLMDKAKAETMAMMEQNNQLAAIGQLAAGVAHEINNPLALINQTAGYIKDLFVIKKQYQEDEDLLENIDSIMEAVDRCGRITSQLLGFSRKFDLTIQRVNLKDAISDVLIFHEKEAVYRNINLSLDVPDDVPLIETDQGKLQQILMNLINNAFQAVDDNSCLDIQVSRNTSETVGITISDTGCGISEKDLQKIFEPFFTTKAKGKGTGLGLAITYGLVKKLHGNITVTSKQNVGTTFFVTLPVNMPQERSDDESTFSG